jgi:hypothetical protein
MWIATLLQKMIAAGSYCDGADGRDDDDDARLASTPRVLCQWQAAAVAVANSDLLLLLEKRL